VAAVPGVDAVGAVSDLPSTGAAAPETYVAEAPAGGAPTAPRQAVYRVATPGYFTAMAIGLRAGRLPDAGDGETAPLVAVVDETLARREWAGGSPLGRRIQVSIPRFDRGFSIEQVWAEVIGVVADVAHGRADATPPGTIYLSHLQAPLWNMALTLRSAAGTGPPLPALRAAIAEVDPNLPLYRVQTMRAVVAEASADLRAVLVAAAGFAAIAVTVAVVGLYGVIALAVRRRRREFGIRLALGAAPRTLLLRVIREGFLLGAAGVAAGLVVSVPVTRVLADLVVGVTPLDSLTLVASAAALAALTGLVSWLAARVNPVETLASE
jgi:hypothetical protein